jgi:hypothetical protein
MKIVDLAVGRLALHYAEENPTRSSPLCCYSVRLRLLGQARLHCRHIMMVKTWRSQVRGDLVRWVAVNVVKLNARLLANATAMAISQQDRLF